MANPGSVGSAMPASEDSQVRRVADLERDIRELGPSIARSLSTTVKTLQDLVAQVNATLVNIDATVQASIAANSYTKSVIDGKVANPPAGSAVTGNVSATGTVAAGGAVSGTTGTFPTGVSSTGVYNKLLTYGGGYKAQYVHVDGTMGYVPSSRRYKQDITSFTIDPKLAAQLRVVTFRYIAAVQNPEYVAKVEVGLIAEEVHGLGLTWLVDYDDQGLPMGVKYELLVLALIPWMQSIEARLKVAGI